MDRNTPYTLKGWGYDSQDHCYEFYRANAHEWRCLVESPSMEDMREIVLSDIPALKFVNGSVPSDIQFQRSYSWTVSGTDIETKLSWGSMHKDINKLKTRLTTPAIGGKS